MSDKPVDPMAMFNQMLGQFEQGFNAMATKAMGTEDFAKVMNTVGGASVGAKKSMGDMMERYLATMNLPSRQELTHIGERLQAVEARLNEIIAILHRAHPEVRGLAKPTAAPRPPRTRTPSSGPKA